MTRPDVCFYCQTPDPTVHVRKHGDGMKVAYVECDACNASGPTGYGDNASEDAVAGWNKVLRPPTPETRAT